MGRYKHRCLTNLHSNGWLLSTATHTRSAWTSTSRTKHLDLRCLPEKKNAALVDAFNLALRRLIEVGTAERPENEYNNPPLAPCKQDDVQVEYSVVQFREIAGLWIISRAAIGLGFLLIVFYRLWNRFKPQLIEKPWFRTMFPYLIPKLFFGR